MKLQTIPAVVEADANVLVLGTSCGILKDLPHARERIDEIRALAQAAALSRQSDSASI